MSLQGFVENLVTGNWVKNAMMIIAVSLMDVVVTQDRMTTPNPRGVPERNGAHPSLSPSIANLHHLLDFQHHTAQAKYLPTLRYYALFVRLVEHDGVGNIMVNKRVFR